MSQPNSTPWRLLETTLSAVRQANYQLAILPFGATEPHNLHLPYGTDVLEANMIGERVAKEAWEKGARVVLLPTLPYGTETNLERFPLAMNLNPTTLLAVIRDLVDSLEKSGIRKLLLLNSHGGNDFKPFLRELYGKTTVQLFLCNWFQAVRDLLPNLFSAPDDHAGEMETSLILAHFPHLVARNPDGSLQADSGEPSPFRFEALQQGWVQVTRPWHLLTSQSGCGNPHQATAEKGENLLEKISERLVPFVVQLSHANLDERFPFVPKS